MSRTTPLAFAVLAAPAAAVLLAAPAAVLGLAAPAAAQDLAPFHQLIDEAIGYVNVGPGLLLIEDDISSTLCRIDIPESFFGAALAGTPPTSLPEIICIPATTLTRDAISPDNGLAPFNVLIDQSIGYINIGPGLLLIEDEVSSNVCRIQIPDLYFLNHASGTAPRPDLAPTIICVPSPDLTP